MFSPSFWRALSERVLSTFAGALLAFILANATGLLDIDWVRALSVAGLAALVSLLKGVAASYVGDDDGPSLTGAEKLSGE